jgi:hypothetical protein
LFIEESLADRRQNGNWGRKAPRTNRPSSRETSITIQRNIISMELETWNFSGTWTLGSWRFPPTISRSSDSKKWLSFANERLAGILRVCHCQHVTRQADTTFVKRVKSLRERPFIVQCSDFRCMAYRDTSGKWWDYFNGDEIKGEVTILSEA